MTATIHFITAISVIAAIIWTNATKAKVEDIRKYCYHKGNAAEKFRANLKITAITINNL